MDLENDNSFGPLDVFFTANIPPNVRKSQVWCITFAYTAQTVRMFKTTEYGIPLISTEAYWLRMNIYSASKTEKQNCQED
jgi:hypothetical protein